MKTLFSALAAILVIAASAFGAGTGAPYIYTSGTNPLNLSTSIFDAPKGAFVYDTNGAQWYLKTTARGDNSGFQVLASGTVTIAVSSTLTTPTLINPTVSGTIAGNVVRTGTLTNGTLATPTIIAPTLSGTASGALTSGTLSATTIDSPALTGTATGVLTSGTFSAPTIVSPTVSGTVGGSYTRTGVITGGTASGLVIGGTTGVVAGTIGVSGTSLFFYNGTAWKQLDN